MEHQLPLKERHLLLEIAREAIFEAISGKRVRSRATEQSSLQVQCGCFVTIKFHGRLRGCIGCFTASTPLAETVREMAIAAATQDPRFYPLTHEELEGIELEISVLSPLKKIESIDEIKPGTHGLYIEKNMFRGVLLPQVATEYGWNRETFLEQTCLKAGLEPDAWKSEADIFIFSAQVFGET